MARYVLHLKSDETTIREYADACDLPTGIVAFESFADPKSAHDARQAKDDPSAYAVTFVPTYFEREGWRDREYERFQTGEYARVPWHEEERYPYHFAHLSLKIPGQIAYTKSDEHGINDRQTIVRPGRYLTEFYNDRFDKKTIDRYVDLCSAEHLQIKITRDADEIEYIYRHGPKSCMDRDPWRYRGHCHPARAYADSPDLAVAYDGEIGDGSIAARAIVWPEKKIVTRIYPHGTCPLANALKHHGYEIGASHMGARLTPIADRNGNGWIMPYIDGIDTAFLVGEYWYLGTMPGTRAEVRETVSTQSTQSSRNETIALGTTSTDGRRNDAPDDEDEDDNEVECANCGAFYDPDNDGGNGYCQGCYDRMATCESCDDTIDTEDDGCFALYDGGYLCRACGRHAMRECEVCEAEWIEDVEFSIRTRNARAAEGLDVLCASCARTHARCAGDGCDAWIPTDEISDRCCECQDVDNGEDDETINESEARS